MATWGSTTVNMLMGTYRPPHTEAGIVEIPLLPGNGDNSVIQQSGPVRRRVSWQGYVTSQTGYDSLHSDYVNGEERSFEGPDSLDIDCVIIELSPPEYVMDGHIRYHITLVEV